MNSGQKFKRDDLSPERILCGYQLKKLWADYGLTGTDVARLMGRAGTQISAWAVGHNIPGPKSIAIMADATGIPDELIYQAIGIIPQKPRGPRRFRTALSTSPPTIVLHCGMSGTVAVTIDQTITMFER